MHGKIPLALLGFGNVGRAFANLLLRKQGELDREYGIRCEVVGISTKRHGTAIKRDGLDLKRALDLAHDHRNISSLSSNQPTSDSFEFIEACGAKVLFETTPVNYKSGQPAVDYLKMGLTQGMHVITANKGPIVHAYGELSSLARSKRRRFLFESTVMDGAPVFSLWRETLPGARLKSFRGILNSTTNFILTQMEQGDRFERALRQAQQIGIAETDPSGDIDGWDSAVKVAALVNVLMETNLTPMEVDREGIRGITEDSIRRSRQAGKRWKLICEAERMRHDLRASVYPLEIDASDPLFNIMGTSSSISFESDVLGRLTVVEEDPGPETTAYGLLADLLTVFQKER